jgi:hypothetical protein
MPLYLDRQPTLAEQTLYKIWDAYNMREEERNQGDEDEVLEILNRAFLEASAAHTLSNVGTMTLDKGEYFIGTDENGDSALYPGARPPEGTVWTNPKNQATYFIASHRSTE